MNQVVRSAGIYTEKNEREGSLVGTLIPNLGSWITVKIDN